MAQCSCFEGRNTEVASPGFVIPTRPGGQSRWLSMDCGEIRGCRNDLLNGVTFDMNSLLQRETPGNADCGLFIIRGLETA